MNEHPTQTYTASWRKLGAGCEKYPTRGKKCESEGEGWVIDLNGSPLSFVSSFLCRKHARESIEQRRALGIECAFAPGTADDFCRALTVSWNIDGEPLEMKQPK